MADISKITTLDGTTYDVKDAVARPFVVTVTYADSTYSADKTFEEITEAYNNNRDIFLVYSSSYYNLYSISSTYIYFNRLYVSTSTAVYEYCFSISSSDAITYTARSFSKSNVLNDFSGGTAGQVLTKNSSASNDYSWKAIPTEVFVVTFDYYWDSTYSYGYWYASTSFSNLLTAYNSGKQIIGKVNTSYYPYEVIYVSSSKIIFERNDLLLYADKVTSYQITYTSSNSISESTVTRYAVPMATNGNVGSFLKKASNTSLTWAPIDAHIPYSDLTTYSSGTVGKELKELSSSVTEINTALSDKMPIVTYGTPEVIVDTTEVSFSKDGDNDWYISEVDAISGMTFNVDTLYKVTWDDTEYEVYYTKISQKSSTGNGHYNSYCVGNIALFYYDNVYNTDAPFVITKKFKQTESNGVRILTLSTEAQHTIKVTAVPYTKTVVNKLLYQDTSDSRPSSYIGSGQGAAIFNYGATATGAGASAFNNGTKAFGDGSASFGIASEASGVGSHAEGFCTVASGDGSHTEGSKATASATYAHAEGYQTTASGQIAHAQGHTTTASGLGAHSEGGVTTASGKYSHAEGHGTIANHKAQHVSGTYNVADSSVEAAADKGNYVEIVGNGTADDARSNARTLDWSGNEVLAGTVTASGFIGNLTGDASTVNGHTVATDVPANAVFTDTNYWQYNSTTDSIDLIFPS